MKTSYDNMKLGEWYPIYDMDISYGDLINYVTEGKLEMRGEPIPEESSIQMFFFRRNY